ncbi:MAG: hypothetical protein QM504_06760 [Pseudomonadota bacterium]
MCKIVFHDGIETEVDGVSFDFDFCGYELILHRQCDVPSFLANRINCMLFVTEKETGFIVAIGNTEILIKGYLTKQLDSFGQNGVISAFNKQSDYLKDKKHLQNKESELIRRSILSKALGVEIPLCNVDMEMVEANIDTTKLKNILCVPLGGDLVKFVARKFGEKEAFLLESLV